MNYQQFKEQFDKDYNDIYDFISKCERTAVEIPYNGRLEADEDQFRYDSYGNEDTSLARIYYFKDYDIYVKFSGTRQSYNGEEWTHMREVKPTQKIIKTFE